jgi:hypothetical protein
MIDRTPVSRDDRAPLPPFEPVPRRKPRHDGWTPSRQVAFIEALADTGSVTRAALQVNMSTESAYQLRRQPGAEGFARAWEAALDMGVLRLKDEAFERALHGEMVPVIASGKLIGYRRRRNDRLVMFILRHYGRRPQSGSFRPHRPPTPAPSPDPAEPDPNAVIAAFAGFELDEATQAQIIAALTDGAARHRARIEQPGPPDDPAAPFVSANMLRFDHPDALQPFGAPLAITPGRHREDEEMWLTLDLPDQRDAVAAFLAEQADRPADATPVDRERALAEVQELRDRRARFARFLATGRPLEEWDDWQG